MSDWEASKLDAERAAHLATRRELSAALARLDDATAPCHGLGCGRCESCVSLARAEVERLRNSHRSIAEQQREACAKECDKLHKMVLMGAGESDLGKRTEQAARLVRATPLVTDQE